MKNKNLPDTDRKTYIRDCCERLNNKKFEKGKNQIINYDRTEDTEHGNRFDSIGEAVVWILGIIGLLFVAINGFYSVII